MIYTGIPYKNVSIVTITRSTYNFKGLIKEYMICCNEYDNRRLGVFSGIGRIALMLQG